MPRGRPPRLDSFPYRGRYRYFATCCVESRRRAFSADRVVLPLVTEILRTWTERGFTPFAYVFMPDHLHMLVEGNRVDADFRRTMTVLRQRTAIIYTRETGVNLWQDGYYERVLRRDEALLSTATYIVRNPVRAGLVEAFEDYPYVWAAPVLGLTR